GQADAVTPLGVSGLTLDLAVGETVGVAGASGAGKTTFADLLAGLVSPQSGRIAIGGQPLTDQTVTRWRDQVAYVSQDPVLFNDTVRHNLLWANPAATDAALTAAMAVAGADRVVARLPLGLDTIVGENGALISGGERQRLALARALLRAPSILILDEATSAIDIASEHDILIRLGALAPKPTIVLIAHRAESLALCDRVLTMANGRVVRDENRDAPQRSGRSGVLM
ncbi:MAG: ATP-binding cassette domain-containing protein, partial [Pseudomonadota bacterium]